MEKTQIKIMAKGETSLKLISIDAFQDMMRLQYLPYLCFSSYKVYFSLYRRCRKANASGFIGEKQKKLGLHLYEPLKTGKVADVSIRWIDQEIGYGVFAERSLRAHEFIGEYTGIIRPKGELSRASRYSFTYPLEGLFFSKYSIDAEHGGNEMRFINHCDHPNAEATSVLHEGVLRIVIQTLRPIAEGEQIHYNYGKAYWKSKPFKKIHRPFPYQGH